MCVSEEGNRQPGEQASLEDRVSVSLKGPGPHGARGTGGTWGGGGDGGGENAPHCPCALLKTLVKGELSFEQKSRNTLEAA